MGIVARHHTEEEKADNLADDATAKRQVNAGRCPGAAERQRQEQIAADERSDGHNHVADSGIKRQHIDQRPKCQQRHAGNANDAAEHPTTGSGRDIFQFC